MKAINKLTLIFGVLIFIYGCTQNFSSKKELQPTAVCAIGEKSCKGDFGNTCYKPAKGESCTNGKVCSFAEKACIDGDQATCYRPSHGETCNVVSTFDASTDLEFEIGGKCRGGGTGIGNYVLIHNKNPAKKIETTISAQGSIEFDYLSGARNPSKYKFPKLHNPIILWPNTKKFVGCNNWYVGGPLISQAFTINGALYLNDELTEPYPENPMDFLIITVRKDKDCNHGGQLGTIERVINTHPSRAIEFKVGSARLSDRTAGLLDPQGMPLLLGCSGLKNVPKSFRVESARFTSPP